MALESPCLLGLLFFPFRFALSLSLTPSYAAYFWAHNSTLAFETKYNWTSGSMGSSIGLVPMFRAEFADKDLWQIQGLDIRGGRSQGSGG